MESKALRRRFMLPVSVQGPIKRFLLNDSRSDIAHIFHFGRARELDPSRNVTGFG